MSALLIRNKVVLLNKGLEIKLRFLCHRLMDRIIARLIDYKNKRQMQPLCVCAENANPILLVSNWPFTLQNAHLNQQSSIQLNVFYIINVGSQKNVHHIICCSATKYALRYDSVCALRDFTFLFFDKCSRLSHDTY